MTDNQFWHLVDKYEINGVVSEDSYKDLVNEVWELDNHNYDELFADTRCFNYNNFDLMRKVVDYVRQFK